MSGVHGSHDLILAKASFLLVDSKVHFRDMIQSALNGAGAKSVKHAGTVDRAVDSLNRGGQDIDCVICDWDMTPAGGLDLLRMIRTRSLPKTAPNIPVVILTTRADAAAVKIALGLDVNGFAITPLSFEKVVKTVHTALTRRWNLQSMQQYAAVPSLTAALQAGPRVHIGKEPARKTDNAVQAPAAQSAKARTDARKPDALKNVRMCNLEEVVSGQVLARDLRDAEGHLLLSKGAVINDKIIGRLKDISGGHAESYHLWVGERESAESRERV